MKVFMSSITPLFSVGLCIAAVGTAAAGSGTLASESPFRPAETKVVVCPLVNASAEKDQRQRDGQILNGEQAFVDAFASRKFNVMDAGTVSSALADAKIDLSDEEQQKKSTLYKIGKLLNADIVAFAIIESIDQHTEHNFFATRKVGVAHVRVWVLDVNNQTALVDGVRVVSKSGGAIGLLGDLHGASANIVKAVGVGIREALKDFLKPYPIEKGSSKKTH